MFQKRFFVFCLSILPFYILKQYIVITFFLFIYTQKKEVLSGEDIDLQKLQSVLRITSCGRGIILFPYATMNWMWDPRMLDEAIVTSSARTSQIRTILSSKSRTKANSYRIVDTFMKKLPQRFYSKIYRSGRVKDATDLRFALNKTLISLF